MLDVAIVTQREYLAANQDDVHICQLQLEEAYLVRAFKRLGVSVQRVGWDDPDFDWCSARCALIRTPWDYFHRFAEFSAWLDRVSEQTRLINDAAILRWNIDKHYLLDLAEQGVAIVPTVIAEQGSTQSLFEIVEQQGWREGVFKPTVSGAARLTHRFSLRDSQTQQIFSEALQQEAMMVQPFLPAVQSEGELSLMVIDGVCTHAIRKIPKAGDFRVQDDHGGSVLPYWPNDEERRFAEQAIAACSHTPLYARVDVVRNEQNQLNLMELELIEPELFFRFSVPAAERLAAAIARQLLV